MTLEECYLNILKDSNSWNPTKSHTIEFDWEKMKLKNNHALNNFFVQIMLFNPDLRDYMINIRKKFEEVGTERLLHTVSLYLFGIYFAENIGYNKLMVSKGIREDDRKEFLQLWAGICLCHDMGYFLEKNEFKVDKEQINTLDRFMEENSILYDCRECMDNDLIEKYYRYRLEENSTIDHGIVGAYFMYDMLMKSCEKLEKLEKQVTYNCIQKMFCAEEIRKRAKKYAVIIAKHNMWFANERNKNMYEKYGLNELIQDKTKNKRYSLQNNSFLFFLGLTDTLEPIKALEYDVKVLESVDLKVRQIGEKIHIIFKKVDDSIYIEELKRRAKGLNDWLNVQTNDIENGFEIILL